jgi:outer membrane protein OmpA-like peptidoglycan-associated protein
VIGRRPSAALLALPFALAIACARSPIVGRPTLGQEVVVLLPGADGDPSGRATVTSQGSTVDLASARSATVVAGGAPPTTPREMSDTELQQIFGDALAALPSAPRLFNLYFRFNSDDDLTVESRALVPEILQVVSGRRGVEVIVVGHTDTTGPAMLNYELGLRRAQTIRTLLVQAGLDPALIEITSHGEGDPLVKTPDETPEPRNRRVEIAVR